MKNFSVQALSLILMLYIASVIVFKQNYTGITYLINLMLIMNYVFIVLIKRDRIFKLNEIVISYGSFVILTLASSFWALNFDLAAFKAVQLFLILINVFIIYNIITKYNLQDSLMRGILLGSFINYVLVLNVIHAPFNVFDQGRAMGTLGNANSLALAMVISILVSIMYLRKGKEISKIFYYFQYINMLLAIYMIILTASKKGILFGSVLIVIYLILTAKNPKELLKLGAMSVIVIVVFLNVFKTDELQNSLTRIEKRFSAFEGQMQRSSSFGSTAERIHFIELGWSHFMDKPLFGHGIDNFRVYGGTYSHNNYIEILFGVGLVGLLLYYSIFFFLLKKILNMEDNYLKIILTLVIFNLLMVNMAQVAYGAKLQIYFLLFISIIAEKNSNNDLKKELFDTEKN